MRSVSNKSCKNDQNARLILIFFNHAFCEVMLKNPVTPDRPHRKYHAAQNRCNLHAG